ncbi:P-loop NTPase fold protein [Escherichia coli]|uniref:P-loop NTPase fold protein n=1 Tax=Escherichia coli TaxID=562 RepID=UPI002B281820|nr:hypothetical protein VEE29_48790 [Escherichia coli]
MKILRQLWNQKGLDAAVEDVPEDRYGFGNIAENISRSILTLPLEASNVVGIEGAWGSGKTSGTVAKLAMRQPFVLFKGLTFQKLCLPGAFRPGDHHNKMLRPGLCVVHASPQYL